MAWRNELKGYERALKNRDRPASDSYLTTARPYLTNLGITYEPDSYLDISHDEILDWIDGLRQKGIRGIRGLSDSSISSVLTLVRALFIHLNGGVKPESLLGIKIRKAKPRVETKGELLTEEEFQKIMRASNPQKRAILRLLWDTGARPSEILGLKREHIVFGEEREGTYADLSFPNTKNGHPRSVSIVDPETLAELRSYLEFAPKTSYIFPSPVKKDAPIQYRTVWAHLKKTADMVGITKKVYPYLFRHTRATLSLNLPASVLDARMGWLAPGMRENYTHLDTSDQRKALRAENKKAINELPPVSEFERMVEEKVQDATREFERRWRKEIRKAMKGGNPQAVRILMEAVKEE